MLNGKEAMQEFVFLVLGLVGGGIISFFISAKFSKGTSSEITESERALQESVHSLTEQLVLSNKLNQYSFSELKKGQATTQLNEIESKLQNIINQSRTAIAAVPSELISDIDTNLSFSRPCPTCGKDISYASQGVDQAGVLEWQYICPEHGRFSVGDTIDY